LLNFTWKLLVPLALINVFAAVAWWKSGAWQFPAALEVRWLLCASLLAIPYVWLGRSLNGATLHQRQYSYAE
jgi:NADH-quinone oxidoreductase subunit H